MTDLILKLFCALKTDRRGVTAMEYAVMAGVVVTLVVTAFDAFYGDVKTALDAIGAAIPT